MLLLATLLSALHAPAEPPSVSLAWSAPRGCPSAEVIERRLHGLLAASDSRGTTASGWIDEVDDGYSLRLEVAGPRRREVRTLHASDCGVLSEAGVLVIAVTVDALATDAASRSSEVPSVPPVPSREARSDRGSPSPPERPRSETPVADEGLGGEADADARPGSETSQAGRLHGSLGIEAGAATGLTPTVTGGLAGELVLRWRSLRLAAGGFHWFSQSTELQPGIGIASALSGGSLRACLALGGARVEVPACLGVDLGAMHGAGTGTAVRPRPVRDLWIGVTAGTGVVGWISPRFGLTLRTELVLGARRPAMFLTIDEQAREVFRMEPVAARVLVGPIISLW